MSVKRFFITALSLAVISVVSCKKEMKEETPVEPEPDPIMVAQVEGIDFKSFNGVAEYGQGITHIVATSIKGETLEIHVVGEKTGSFNIPFDGDGYAIYRESPNDTIGYTTKLNKNLGGNVVITKLDTFFDIAEGLFELTLESPLTHRVIKVKNGEFKKMPVSVLAPLSGAVYAEVDKVQWATNNATASFGGSGDEFTLTATDPRGQQIVLKLIGDTTGPYPQMTLGTLEINTGQYYRSAEDIQQYANCSAFISSMKVDTNKKEVSGTFSFSNTYFTGKTRSLKNGVFTNVKYTGIPAKTCFFRGLQNERRPVNAYLNGLYLEIADYVYEKDLICDERIVIPRSLPASATPYPIGGASKQSYIRTNCNTGQGSVVLQGQLVITEHDSINKKISGRYLCIILDGAIRDTVTNGGFSARY